MTYKVIDIEGVGDVYAEKLIAAGIKTDAEPVGEVCKTRWSQGFRGRDRYQRQVDSEMG